MPSRGRLAWAAAIAALALPATAAAHGFGRLYNLPVPLWLYAYGATAALVVSFLAVGYFMSAPAAGAPAAERDLADAAWVRALRRLRVLTALRALSLGALALTVVSGFFGSPDPLYNFSMTAFWIVFVLGVAYLSALFGDFYAAINPWLLIARALGRVVPGYGRGRLRYPAALGDWPALALYLGFICVELFGYNTPASLARMLTAYTALSLAGAWLFGIEAWFRHGEFFGVFFRLLALMSPLDYRPAMEAGRPGTLSLRWPFAGLARERPESLATLAFALAMLSTTAFDGLHATQWWVGLFWNDPGGVAKAIVDTRPVLAIRTLLPWYEAWEAGWLLASPFLYLAAYLVAIALAKIVTASRRPLRELALDFGYTLLPIALVYNVTHYATLVLSQGTRIVSLLSDPFGRGWNLIGTAHLLRMPILPPMNLVWHTQVGLILFGHVASVCVAHVVALRLFPTRGAALRSQVPMLILMVAFTIIGLWILAQPLTEVKMR